MDTKRVTIKIPAHAKEKLDAIASKQRRNLVNTLEYALDLYLAMHESDGTTKYSLDSIIDQRSSNISNDLFDNNQNQTQTVLLDKNINNINESNEIHSKQATEEYTPLF